MMQPARILIASILGATAMLAGPPAAAAIDAHALGARYDAPRPTSTQVYSSRATRIDCGSQDRLRAQPVVKTS